MSKTTNVTTMQEKLARLNERTKSTEAELKRLQEKRTHNLCGIGGLVYKYFGDDISPEEFKEMLDFLFAINEVQDFVTEEKEKRFLRDNPPVVISENTNLSGAENDIVENA